MVESDSVSVNKCKKFAEFENYAKCWTLKQDKELKDALQSTVSGMLDSIRHFESVGNALESEMELFECRFENVHNRIGCLKMERLVKEQVDEIPADLLRGFSKKAIGENLANEVNQEEYEQRTISTISNAIRRSFDLFDIRQREQSEENTQNNGDPSDPTSSTELPKIELEKSANYWDGMEFLRRFERCEMPPIIGTAEFYEAIRRSNETKTNSPKANERREGNIGSSLPTKMTTTTTKPEEEDIASLSSGRSAPPQDPVVVVVQQLAPIGTAEEQSGPSGRGTLTMRSALMEEIAQRSRKRAENTDKEEKSREKRELSQQTQRVEGNQRIGERHQQTTDNEKEHQRQREQREADTQRHLVIESEERRQANAERQGAKEDTEQRPRTKGKRKSSEKLARKSLFSSSSEGEGDEEEEGEKEFNHSLSVSLLQPILENRTQQLSNLSDSNLGRSLSQRPLSVQSFGTSAGDEISDDQRTNFSGQRPAFIVRKTESSKTMSVVSNNEEFGPTSVKNRIAQIGAQIPMGRRAPDGIRRDEDDQPKQINAITEPTPPIATPLPTEAIKNRAKAPSARRAPSQRTLTINGKLPMPPLPSSSSPLEAIKETPPQQKNEEKNSAYRRTDTTEKQLIEEKQCHPPALEAKTQGSSADSSQAVLRTTSAKKVPPPPVKPKKTVRSSIFSSSSSDDDLGFSNVIGKAKMKVPPSPPQRTKANEVPKMETTTPSAKQPLPFSYKKSTATTTKTRKGLFDDTDSDF